MSALPQPVNTSVTPAAPDLRFPATLANAPFLIDQYVPANQATGDLVHRWYQEQLQINGGLMNKFASVSDAKGLVMGYYHTMQLPMAKEAATYTLCDHFFHAAFGGSFLNHQWLIAAASPVFATAPAGIIAKVDATKKLVTDGAVTPDGCEVVNTSFTTNKPHPSGIAAEQLVPNQKHATIGDRLSAKGVDWAWYSGGWNDAIAGKPDAKFQFHHQPFAYFANYADGTDAKKAHLKDEADFLAAIANNTLPPVVFYKPIGAKNEHPGYANVIEGEQNLAALVDAIRKSPAWASTAIIITYDENGGFWDHVAPPKVDRFGPGTRVPTLVISPYAKKHFVDSTVYDTTSILALIEHKYGLDPLSPRDANAADMANAFDFSQP